MDSLPGRIQPEGALLFVRTRVTVGEVELQTMRDPIRIQKMLRMVKAVFLQDANHNSLFMKSQKAPGTPKLNQLAKSAV